MAAAQSQQTTSRPAQAPGQSKPPAQQTQQMPVYTDYASI